VFVDAPISCLNETSHNPSFSTYNQDPTSSYAVNHVDAHGLDKLLATYQKKTTAKERLHITHI
jgi:hypothetical protein